jgi:hypothetical protein
MESKGNWRDELDKFGYPWAVSIRDAHLGGDLDTRDYFLTTYETVASSLFPYSTAEDRDKVLVKALKSIDQKITT